MESGIKIDKISRSQTSSLTSYGTPRYEYAGASPIMKLGLISLALIATLLLVLTLACSDTESPGATAKQLGETKSSITASSTPNKATAVPSIATENPKENPAQPFDQTESNTSTQAAEQPKDYASAIKPNSTTITPIRGTSDICDWTPTHEIRDGSIYISSDTSPEMQRL